ncbi:MAG: glutaredoxin family protein [Gaiellaceae bacterium]
MWPRRRSPAASTPRAEAQGSDPKGVQGSDPKGVEGSDPKGVQGSDPERARGSDPERVQGSDPERVVLYHAQGCHLCERARAVLVESGVPFAEVDITGEPGLEAAYREWLPVVEIDGERAFVYYVDPAAFERKVAAQS